MFVKHSSAIKILTPLFKDRHGFSNANHFVFFNITLIFRIHRVFRIMKSLIWLGQLVVRYSDFSKLFLKSIKNCD
jgi:hypothetical protein